MSSDGETVEVPFNTLLQFHLPELHYELDRDNDNALGKLKSCPTDCKTKEMCGIMQKSLLIGDYIRDRKSTRLNSSHSQQSRMPSSA